VSGDAIRLRFPARPEYLLLARLAVAAVARRMALGRVEVGDLKLAVTEACSNAVRHAYAKGPPGEIALELLVDGDRLDVTRDAAGHVAFGHGVHHCLGAPLARMEMRIAFPALLRRFPRLALAVPFDEVEFRAFHFIYGLRSLPVTW